MKHWTTLLLLPLLCAACSKNTDEAADPATRSIEVAIGSGPRLDIRPQSTTRTELGDDGVSVKWQTGDRLALWAVNSAAQTVVDAVAFSLYHYNATYNSANFRGNIPQMAEDTYTYYAVSPVPASTDGLRASYDIPAVQDGTFHGEWDVMVATPIEGAGPLREHDKKDANGISDNTDVVDLQFAHKIHVLKIAIPRNDLGEPVSEIKLTFPTPVVGRLTVDAANPAAAAELSESSNTLTLRFSEPKEAEDVVYALIAPVTLEEGQEVSIVASSSALESEERTFAPAGRTFAAGHTTPINYNVPAAAVQLTQLIFTLAETGVNTLGEAINTFTVTAPSGWSFEDGSQSRTFDVTGTGDYTVRFRGYTNPTEEMAGFQVTYDSEHALLSETFTLPAVTAGAVNRVKTFSVPWLLYEDFSGVTTNSNYDNPAVGGTTIADGDGTAIDLSNWGVKTPGWTAARVGTEAGKAIRICARVENQSFASNTYNARLDSAPFSTLKEGKNPKVKVTFNYKGGRWSVERKLFGGDAGPGNGDAIYSCGYTSEQGWQPGSTTIPYLLKNNVVIPGTSGAERNQNQNYDNISYEDSFIIPSASNTTRASWMVSSTTDTAPFSGFNGNYWLYLDNIKVQIAQ
ncbi:fimbrillin family protein [uncultured Alistipes sp.]|uniref:fimbrillin family protein n=1 Tax=uncultured Alistipes sp. TaxID=538949 RepID=UPI003209B05A